MNYKEYLKRRLMEETDPSIEDKHASVVHFLVALFNDNPELFKNSENARARLIRMGNQHGMRLGGQFDPSQEGARESGALFPNNRLPIYLHDPSRSQPIKVSMDTPIPLTGRTEQEREYAERIGRHETRFRNQIRAMRRDSTA